MKPRGRAGAARSTGLRIGVGTDNQRGDVKPLPDLNGRIDAVAIARQPDIHQDEVGTHVIRQRDGTLCRAGKTDHLVAGLDHRRLDIQRHEHLILDDKNTAASDDGVRDAPGVGFLAVGAIF